MSPTQRPIARRLCAPIAPLVSLAVGLALASVALPSAADPYDAAMAEGVAAKERALDKNDPAAWAEALRDFQAADDARSTKESKYELAVAATHLRADDVAVESYEAALAMGLSGTAKDKAKAFVAGNAPKMARLTLLAPPRTRIEIDDRPRGLAPLARPVVVFAGKVHLRAIADGGRTVDEQLVTAPGETRTLDLQAKLAAPAPSSSASSGGGAGVASSSASSASPEAPLPHLVDADDDGAPARTLGWTLTLGGAALAVVGGGTILLAGTSLSSKRDALTADCFAASGTDACVTANPGRTSAAQDDVDSIATWKGVRIGGIVALGTGVSIAAVGLVRLLTAPSPTITGRWTPTLDLAAHGGTFGLRGAF